jgi:hercynine metabolism protein
MSTWLDQLERELDQRLSAFLRSNPLQDQLFREQHQQDRAIALQRQRQQLQQEAEQQRRRLIDVAEEIRSWTDRTTRAKQAGADDLAHRAQDHLEGLMAQGRDQWNDLDKLGRRFAEVEAQLKDLAEQTPVSQTGLEQDWALFEAQQELERLRRDKGLS